MKVATWNVNSIRARFEHMMSWLEKTQPDVVLLQELKCLAEQFPYDELGMLGYRCAVNGQKTYNGVAILVRGEEPKNIVVGFDDDVEDTHARAIAATAFGVRFMSLYAPNGQEVGAPAYDYKLAWFGRLRAYLDRRHQPSEPLVLGGDWNVAPEDRDVHDPAEWAGQILCSEAERAALRDLRGFGLVDLFRRHHDEPGLYSWWDYRALGFAKNRGLRIDTLFVTETVAARCVACAIDREARKGSKPSDHAPVVATIEGTGL